MWYCEVCAVVKMCKNVQKCACVPGELFFIGYQMDKKPACVYYAGLDKEGKLQFDVRVNLKEGVMMHDMAITQAWALQQTKR